MAGRYRYVKRPGHPLAPASGQIPLHRVVLYDRIGPGHHRCNWCPAEVAWSTKGAVGALVADHVDGNTQNNSPDNLVPSCHPCNTRRGHDRRLAQAAAVMVTEKGRKEAVECTCLLCGRSFLVAKTDLDHSGDRQVGGYCSARCRNTANARANAEAQKAVTDALAPRIWELRGQQLSLQKIADTLTAEGTTVSKSLVYSIMKRTDPARHAADQQTREAELAALYVVRNGMRHKAVRRTCEGCGEGFLVIAAALRQANTKGRFCSRDCHYASRRKAAG
ncbi:HNH endonuclease signature motif containing protein [Streptomyces cellulosae]